MKRIVFTVLLLLIFSGSVQAQSTPDNGYWWLSLSEEYKLGYVVGYVRAMVLNNDFRFFQCLAAKNGGVVPDKYPGDSAIKECNKASEPQFDFSQLRFGQLKDGLDEFYKDFRNKAILISAAIGYVRDQLRGKSDEELSLKLEQMRKSANTGHQENRQ